MKKIPLIALIFSLFFFNSCEDYSVTITGKKDSSSQSNNLIDGLKDGWAAYANSSCNLSFYYPVNSNYTFLPSGKESVDCIFYIIDFEEYLDSRLFQHEVDLGVTGAGCGIAYKSIIIRVLDNIERRSLLDGVRLYHKHAGYDDEFLSVIRMFNMDVIHKEYGGMDYSTDVYYFKIPNSDRIACVDFYGSLVDREREILIKSIRNIVSD